MRVPNFIKPLDLEKERKSIIEEFKQKSGKLDYIPLVGDDYMSLIDIFLFRLNNFIELLNFKISQNYLNFSSGEYLDELVALAGIKRNEEVKPISEFKISVNGATFLPKGAKFTDTKGHNAYLLNDVYINDFAIVKVEAEGQFNQNYNTNTLEIPNIYISNIEQISPYSGFKARESDKELRERFLLSMHRFSTAGSAKSYLFYILSVEGITKASVYQLLPGVVQIVYLSKFDDETAKLKISEALDGRIPLTDEVRIKPANKISLDLVLSVELLKDFMFSEVIKNVDFRVREFFKTLEISQNPHSSKIIDVAFDENIKSLEVASQIPSVDKDSILILNSLQILKADNA